MTGFIRGLFGKKSKKEENAFFLDADSAKTYGDIDYMRTAKTVKKSFPKGLGEVAEAISSLDKAEIDLEEQESTAQKAEKIEIKPQFKKSEPTVGTSTDMDMFRKMAKEVKKR